MYKTKKTKIFIIFSLTIIFALMSFSPIILAKPTAPSSIVQEKLQGISNEERNVLQNLFALAHDIEEIERQEKGLTQDIETLNGEIDGLKTAITGEENTYKKKLDVLKQLLQIYQRKGPGSSLEIILDSEDLNMFLWRISTLQDLSRNTGNLLKSLGENKGKLDEKKAGLNEKLTLMKDKQEKLKESLNKNLQLKQDQEKYLASLKEQKKPYQEQLNNLQQVWSDLKLLFSDASGEFSRIIKDGGLPADAIKINFTLQGIEASIDEKTFNGIIAGNPRLFEMAFSFHLGRVEISVPKMNLVLTGTFDILDGNTLKFTAKGGSFYGMPLDSATIEELFKGGNLVLNLDPFINSSTLDSVEIAEGSLKFIIKPVF